MASEQDAPDRDEVSELDFQWHPAKAAANLKKHGVSFKEALTVFGDKKHIVVPDREHSWDEERSLAIGMSNEGRMLTMCFTERGDRLRIISARVAERWERREYEIANEYRRGKASRPV
ncbi:MAG TPA: BrnT family toxin [Terracidiphilus sp.]|jgi:hypothetical protein|nr:BrnT family toxin [Terracidiphilus sp.]